MPPELTPAQRLTQIEKILESAIKLSHSNTGKIEANSRAIDALGEKVDRVTDRVDRVTEQLANATQMFVDLME